jgi:CelD/BcsL family acetyltransferase involved in cellulose biosynthesis
VPSRYGDTIIEIYDRIDPLADEWERLAQHLEASPFLRPGWVLAWWRAFGAGRLQILAAYQNGRLAGVLPLCRYRGVLSSTTNEHSPLSAFLAANGAAAEALAHALFSQKPRRIDLHLLPSYDVGVTLVHKAAENAGYRIIADSMHRSPYVVVNETGWDTYQSGLSKKLRKDLRRSKRQLEQEGQLTLEVCDGTENLDERLREGFSIEGSGWKEAEGTNINSHPATRRFYTEIAHWAAEQCGLRLAFLRLDGQPLAFDFCLEYRKVHYLLKTGYDPAYARFSPGKILRHLMLARAFSERLAIYDMGGGVEPYKQRYTDKNRELQTLRMFAPTPLGFLERKALEYGRPAYRRARGLAGSIFGERGYRLLKRGRALTRARLGR